MRYCDKCGVTIAGEEARCPLCQSMTLPRGGDSRPPFPDVPTLYAEIVREHEQMTKRGGP